jgi:hypothetical protein
VKEDHKFQILGQFQYKTVGISLCNVQSSKYQRISKTVFSQILFASMKKIIFLKQGKGYQNRKKKLKIDNKSW